MTCANGLALRMQLAKSDRFNASFCLEIIILHAFDQVEMLSMRHSIACSGHRVTLLKMERARVKAASVARPEMLQ